MDPSSYRSRRFVNARLWIPSSSSSAHDDDDDDKNDNDALSLLTPDTNGWFDVDESGRFSAVGSSSSSSPSTASPPSNDDDDGVVEVIDLGGRTVLPGLIDSHIHVAFLGESKGWVDLSHACSIEDVVDAVREAAAASRTDDEWIVGVGLDQDALTGSSSSSSSEQQQQQQQQQHREPSVAGGGGTYPTVDDLELAAPGRAVWLWRRCWHVGVASREALRRAGVNASTRVEGGAVDVDDEGTPTGLLRETACRLMLDAIQRTKTFAESEAHVRHGLRACVDAGLTSVQTNDARCAAVYRKLDAENSLPLRVALTIDNDEIGTDDALPPNFVSTSGMLSCHRAKIFADGSLGARTAALREPYVGGEGDDDRGMLLLSPDALAAEVRRARAAGYRSEIHAIGDRAAEAALDALEAAGSTPEERPVLTHAQILGADLIARMARANVIANVQPSFVPTDAPTLDARLSPELQKHAYAWRTLARAGVPCAGGSDAPVETPSPLTGIRDAATRRSRDGERAVFRPEERLSLRRAVELYTTGGAYAAGRENTSGEIETGRDADFVVLEPGVLERLGRDDLDDDKVSTRVAQVWVGGKRRDRNDDDDEKCKGPLAAIDGPYQPGRNGPWTVPHDVFCGGACGRWRRTRDAPIVCRPCPTPLSQ